jgi:hypothetical protein
MSVRAVTASVVNLALSTILVFMHVTHGHLTLRTQSGEGAVVPQPWVDAALICAMAGATAWWLLGRKAVSTNQSER